MGEGGSGKSALLKALVGRYVISHGKISHLWYETYKQEHTISRSPVFPQPPDGLCRRAARFQKPFQYQRFFISSGSTRDTATIRQPLGIFYGKKPQNTSFRTIWKHNGPQKWTIDRVVETFHLASLLTTHLIKLSNGETKRLRMAAALLKNPKILLLDNPLNGLDVATRERFEDIFAEIAASGTTIIMATRPERFQRSLPMWRC
ncbi:MAG: ATP-binding cassette domain-containing protein [Desulfobacterales bacterium]